MNMYGLLLDIGSVHIANIDDTIHDNITYNDYINNHRKGNTFPKTRVE